MNDHEPHATSPLAAWLTTLADSVPWSRAGQERLKLRHVLRAVARSFSALGGASVLSQAASQWQLGWRSCRWSLATFRGRFQCHIIWLACVSTALTFAVAPARPLAASAAHRRTPRIVFEGYPSGTGHFWLYSIQIDGRGLQRIAVDGWDAAVSSDHSRIAFTDGGGVSVVGVNGRHRRHLVGGYGDAAQGPSWSPDGKRIAFTRAGGNVRSGIWTMSPDGSRKRFLPRAPIGGYVPNSVAWFDARRIVTIARNPVRFALIDARDGSVERWITPPTIAAAVTPAVSPNRHEFAYDECDGSNCSSSSVVIMTLAGHLVRRIRGANSAAWTPAGALLYTLANRIMIHSARGGRARAITPRTLPAHHGVWLG